MRRLLWTLYAEGEERGGVLAVRLPQLDVRVRRSVMSREMAKKHRGSVLSTVTRISCHTTCPSWCR